MRYKIAIGDWSGDGHEKSENFIFESNKDYKDVIQAYKKACELSGVALHGEASKKCTVLCSDYEENLFPHDAFDKLQKIGINLMDFADCDHTQPYDEDGEYQAYSEGFVKLFLAMAKTQLPDFEYEIVKDDLITINVHQDGFSEFMGYGLFY